MRRENVSLISKHNRTVDEQWFAQRDYGKTHKPRIEQLIDGVLVPLEIPHWQHWYNGSADFAVGELKGNGRCLVVGSPLFEAFELQDEGWSVTYVDVRKPPTDRLRWVFGDASDLPFDDESFDAVSSSCVICHVGLGRYGDGESEDGDYRMMREIRRVLKPGGLAVLSLPVASIEITERFGTCHRIYAMREVNEIVRQAGMTVVKAAVWDAAFGRWRPTSERLADTLALPDYLSVLLRR